MVEHRYLTSNLLRFHVATAGPSDGRLILLLHGFPEYWYGWRHQIEPLAEAGFSVWAPDQRGYNRTDKPQGIAPYALENLTADVIGLIHAAGRERAIVVGHDWGGVVAWHLAATKPETLERAVILNVPHPAVMLRHLWRNPRQMLRSWYVGFFQLPWLPEACLGFQRGWPLARALRRTSRPATFSTEEFQQYREAWFQPKPDCVTVGPKDWLEFPAAAALKGARVASCSRASRRKTLNFRKLPLQFHAARIIRLTRALQWTSSSLILPLDRSSEDRTEHRAGGR